MMKIKLNVEVGGNSLSKIEELTDEEAEQDPIDFQITCDGLLEQFVRNDLNFWWEVVSDE